MGTSRLTSPRMPKTSQGASTATGRMRPDCNCRKASATTDGASVGWLMRSAHLVNPRIVAS